MLNTASLVTKTQATKNTTTNISILYTQVLTKPFSNKHVTKRSLNIYSNQAFPSP